MSPRPAAPRRASISACARRAPSAGPASPPPPGKSTPPRTSAASSENACASSPMPTRTSLIVRRHLREKRLDEREVVGGRDLDEPPVTHDEAHPAAATLDEPGAVGRV